LSSLTTFLNLIPIKEKVDCKKKELKMRRKTRKLRNEKEMISKWSVRSEIALKAGNDDPIENRIQS
jgi:hypothetical protein